MALQSAFKGQSLPMTDQAQAVSAAQEVASRWLKQASREKHAPSGHVAPAGQRRSVARQTQDASFSQAASVVFWAQGPMA